MKRTFWLIYSHGKNVYFDKLIIAGGRGCRGCAIVLIYFARKNDTVEKSGRFEGTGFSHLVVNGRYMYICEYYQVKYDLVPEYTIHFTRTEQSRVVLEPKRTT